MWPRRDSRGELKRYHCSVNSLFNTPANQRSHKVGRQIYSVIIRPQRYCRVSCLSFFPKLSRTEPANLLTFEFYLTSGACATFPDTPTATHLQKTAQTMVINGFHGFQSTKVYICGRVTVTEWTQRGTLYVLYEYCLFGN